MAVDDIQKSTSTEPRRTVPTLEEVAARAGVSRSTASRAINGGQRVSPAAQAAVDAAIVELSYSPNRAARSLVTRRTDSIALVVPEPDERVLTDPFFAGTLNGLSAALAGSDLQLVLLIARPEDGGRTNRYLRNGHVDGAVVVSHHESDGLDVTLRDSGLPAVFVGRPMRAAEDLHYVDVDNYSGGRLATEHLISLGRTRIGTICGPSDMAAGVDRRAGWHDALVAANLVADAVMEADFTTSSAAEATGRLLDEHPDLDGIFVASDIMAIGTMNVLRERGLSVPEQISVVGFDNIGVTTSPALTTITNPVVAMTRAAGHLLLDQLAGADGEIEHKIFSPELVIRRSTAPRA